MFWSNRNRAEWIVKSRYDTSYTSNAKFRLLMYEYLIDLGDNILLPQPGFPLYEVIAKAHRVECKFYRLLVRCWRITVPGITTI